jgi:hypothetical protein
MKKLFLALSTIITLGQLSFAEGLQTQTREFPKEEMQKQNREIVRLSSEEISKTLPQKIDKYTTLTAVEGKDTTLVYTFEINTGAKSDDAVRKEDKTRMQRAVTAGICQSASKFLAAQISISYVYISTASKAELFRFDVSQADCPNAVR